MKNYFVAASFVALLAQASTAQTVGTLDKTFGTNGYANLSFNGTFEKANAMAFQADGKVIVVGENINATTPALDQVYIVRLDAAGKKDVTFGSAGIAKIDIGDKKEYGRDVAVLPDGKILVLGSATVGTTGDAVVFRLSSVGVLDATFGTAGKATVNYKNQTDIARSMVVLSDGKILVASDVNGEIVVSKLNANGSIDTGFGASGFALYDGDNQMTVAKMAVQKDGKIVVAAHEQDGNTQEFNIILVRFAANGTLDATFGTNGTKTLSIGTGLNEFVYNLAIQNDNKILVSGKVAPLSAPTKYETMVCRFTTTGALDATFGTGGFFKNDLNANNEEPRGIAIQPDGKIVCAGTIGDDMSVVRLTSAGQLDLTFNTIGYKIIDYPNTTKDLLLDVKIAKDGKIYVCGSTNNGSQQEDMFIARMYSGLVSSFEADSNTIPVSVFPNPANDKIAIGFSLEIASDVLIELYDLNGKKINTLAKTTFNAGENTIQLDLPQGMANGLYLCRVQTNRGATNKEIMILR